MDWFYVRFLILTIVCRKTSIYATHKKEFQLWYIKVVDQKFHCPAPEKPQLNPSKGQMLLEIVNCQDQMALYRYDFKVQRGLEQRGFLCLEKSALLKNALYKVQCM